LGPVVVSGPRENEPTDTAGLYVTVDASTGVAAFGPVYVVAVAAGRELLATVPENENVTVAPSDPVMRRVNTAMRFVFLLAGWKLTCCVQPAADAVLSEKPMPPVIWTTTRSPAEYVGSVTTSDAALEPGVGVIAVLL
jgi:hypothetical protein